MCIRDSRGGDGSLRRRIPDGLGRHRDSQGLGGDLLNLRRDGSPADVPRRGRAVRPAAPRPRQQQSL
eukprot:2683821-Alexandrium_andersonii.AAC.1